MSIYELPSLLIFCVVLAAVLGAAFGSFLNCAAYRLAHGGSALKGGSVCPSCGHALGAPDLIPILSWLILRGKCRHCGARISPRYLITECLFALVTVLCLLRFDLTALCLRNWVFLCCLFCLSLVDLENGTIPDRFHIISAAAWLLALPFIGYGWRDIAFHALAAVLYGGALLLISLAMDKALGKETLGGGDVKLFAVIALYLGLVTPIFAMLLSCAVGLAVAALMRKGRGEAFPFGPALAAGAGVMLLYGDSLTQWYLGLF